MYTLVTRCRACGYGPPITARGSKLSTSTDRLVKVFDLGLQPLANDFQDETGTYAGFAPLEVLLCPACSLAQLSVVVAPEILYSHYSYITSASDTMQKHFAALWSDIQRQGAHERVIEIGSNTGDFLAFAGRHGAKQFIGVDPAANLVPIAKSKGVTTIPLPLNQTSAREADRSVQCADAVVARHVFCHVDDWKSFLKNLCLMGHHETLYYIEVPYVGDMLKSNSWDQIYHEHLSYLSLKAMRAAVAGTDLRIHSIKHYPIHGGALVITLGRKWSQRQPDPESNAELDKEDIGLQEWMDFSNRAKQQQRKLREMLNCITDQNKSVVGFGASAKSTVWINACRFNRNDLKFICDSTPQKQYRFTPGTDIPISDEGALLRELPDFAVIFCWNFLEEVLQKQKLYLEKGGRFIVPVPEIRIVPE